MTRTGQSSSRDGPFDAGDELDYYAYLGGLTGNGPLTIIVPAGTGSDDEGNQSPVAASAPVLQCETWNSGTVFDGAIPGDETSILSSTTSLQANWSGFSDPNGTIVDYQWSIGTYPGGSDVLGPTDVGLATAAEADGLSLVRGVVYYVTIQAFDDQGLTSSATSTE